MDLVEVSSQSVSFVDGQIVEDDITVEYVDASEVEASGNTFSSLSDAGDYIRSHAASRDATIKFTVTDSSLTKDNFFKKLRSTLLKHTGIPGQGDNLFYQLVGYNASYSSRGSTYDVEMEMEYYTTAAQERAVTNAINKAISSLDIEGKSQTVKICAIYDYICQNVEYDFDHQGDTEYLLQYTTYGAIVNKKAVCQGYANLFYQMCLTAGVTNVRIDDGNASDGSVSGGHAWNVVKINGKWYYADSTWDAGFGPGQYEYFLRGTSFFNKEHTSDWNYAKDLSIPSGDYQGWLYHFGSYCYRGSDVKYVASWKKIDGSWYYFGSYGFMSTGWEKINNVWYYFGKDGAMVTGWQKIGGSWYYFEASGAMVSGSWKKLSGKWYYFQTSGVMKKGWLKYSGSWYYFDSTGAMVCSTSLKISGKTYKFDSTGVCTNP